MTDSTPAWKMIFRQTIGKWIRIAAAWLCFIGMFTLLAGTVIWALLLLIETQVASANVYFRVASFVVVPSIVGAGGGCLLLGILLQYRTGWSREAFAALHLPTVSQGTALLGWLGFASILGGLVAYDIVKVVEFTDSTEFCAKTCHWVMGPESTVHKTSAHANVHCAQCHVGPGAFHYLASKVRASKELYMVATNSYDRPIGTPIESLRSPEEICMHCHWPGKVHSDKLKAHTYYLPDQTNTRFDMQMLMKINVNDTSDSSAMPKTGVHWHTDPGHELYFIALDAQKQQIPYMKLVKADGSEVVYLDTDSELSSAELLQNYPLQKMDCLDCHNRAAHQFLSPQQALNKAMAAGRISPELPFIKQQALLVLGAKYATTEEAVTAIATVLTSYYEQTHPDVWAAKPAMIAASIAAVQDTYRHYIRPEMNVDWQSHPDNISHLYSKGCFRCHQATHQNEAGATPPTDCDSCHLFMGQGQGSEAKPLDTTPQPFVHPEDIDEMWREMACSECHTGKGAAL